MASTMTGPYRVLIPSPRPLGSRCDVLGDVLPLNPPTSAGGTERCCMWVPRRALSRATQAAAVVFLKLWLRFLNGGRRHGLVPAQVFGYRLVLSVITGVMWGVFGVTGVVGILRYVTAGVPSDITGFSNRRAGSQS
ncbi:MAG: hypothetical protein BJ554DRAFT_582 [Olpidium bornovanus]|uniref:Uncharacterized protein n=1 Tax=Olpidium bornovanus TaxID=278681 RepID=A0A8H8A2L7_9FUNG|nr:MAG: hypothetical protein BJ554DRAFT_582 [Olpidium bornovanus]